MKSTLQAVLCGIAALTDLVAAAPTTPHYFHRFGFTRRDLTVQQIQTELAPQLSNATTIVGPSDSHFENATRRWNPWAKPDIKVVVQPAVEDDVATTIRYCEQNSIDFLAVNRGHGNTIAMESLTGLQVDLGSLTSIKVNPDRKSAWVQGGAYGELVINELWKEDLVTPTGSCTCVGLLGPGLGGGHGRLEGFYGMVSDNLLQFNVVLANGTAIVVNRTSHSDLYWGMRGAGHNFGIVTSVEVNTFPRGPPTWHWHNYLWTQDKLEEVFTKLNEFHKNGSTPVEMAVNFGFVGINTTVSTTEPSLFWTFVYAGSADSAEALLAPFNEIGAAWEGMGDVPYPEVALAQGTNKGGPLCVPQTPHITSTANLQVYNVTAERQIYDAFVKWIAIQPEFSTALILHEGYSDKAVHEDFDPADSAYPHRSEHHLTEFTVGIDPGMNLASQAQEFATEILNLWNSGQPDRVPTTYVNYATGLESVESMYGPEPWRLERLRDLKSRYDPANRFRFYNPIIRN